MTTNIPDNTYAVPPECLAENRPLRGGRAVDFWKVIYEIMIRRGLDHHDAQDITQGLFLKLTRSGQAERWEKEAQSTCHLRNLLARAAVNHWKDEYRRRHQQRRGGWVFHCSLESDNILDEVVCTAPTPCEAANLCELKQEVNLAIKEVAFRHHGRGRSTQFAAAISCLLDEGAHATSEDAARAIQLDGNAFRALLYRIRRELAGVLRRASAA